MLSLVAGLVALAFGLVLLTGGIGNIPLEWVGPAVAIGIGTASVAGEGELAFARAGRLVLSNAKNFRLDDDVPLVIPEVNADHLALLEVQRRIRGWSGRLVTNANCASR